MMTPLLTAACCGQCHGLERAQASLSDQEEHATHLHRAFDMLLAAGADILATAMVPGVGSGPDRSSVVDLLRLGNSAPFWKLADKVQNTISVVQACIRRDNDTTTLEKIIESSLWRDDNMFVRVWVTPPHQQKQAGDDDDNNNKSMSKQEVDYDDADDNSNYGETLFAHVCRRQIPGAILALASRGADTNEQDDKAVTLHWPLLVAQRW